MQGTRAAGQVELHPLKRGDHQHHYLPFAHRFDWIRANEHVVLATPAELNVLQTDPQWLLSVADAIRKIEVPHGYDLLVNPFFFTGSYRHRVLEGAVGSAKVVEDDVTFTTLANVEA